MPLPVLVSGLSEAQYRTLYENTYCKKPLTTHDGINVFFRKQTFDHAFFEGSHVPSRAFFSLTRAERMHYIAHALTSATAERRQGWVKKAYDPKRMVTITIDDFVVVLGMYLSGKDELCANFVTCYVADNSIGKIKAGPAWDKVLCMQNLKKKGR